jgi:hypothetical protein
MDQYDHQFTVAIWIQEAAGMFAQGVIYYVVPLTLYWTLVE